MPEATSAPSPPMVDRSDILSSKQLQAFPMMAHLVKPSPDMAVMQKQIFEQLQVQVHFDYCINLFLLIHYYYYCFHRESIFHVWER